MDTKATATLLDGSKISGRLTTDHAASSYGQPVFVDENNQARNWADIADIQTTSAQQKGGHSTSPLKAEKSRENGKLSKGWPKGKARKPKGAS
jgi:hypothetical protein